MTICKESQFKFDLRSAFKERAPVICCETRGRSLKLHRDSGYPVPDCNYDYSDKKDERDELIDSLVGSIYLMTKRDVVDGCITRGLGSRDPYLVGIAEMCLRSGTFYKTYFDNSEIEYMRLFTRYPEFVEVDEITGVREVIRPEMVVLSRDDLVVGTVYDVD